jgi:hypothetical protein
VLDQLNPLKTSIDRLDQAWLENLPQTIPLSIEYEIADRYINTADGRIRDGIRQLRLPWLIIATVDAYPNGTLTQRVVATRWIERALNETDLLQIGAGGPLNWNRAETTIAMKYLIGMPGLTGAGLEP